MNTTDNINEVNKRKKFEIKIPFLIPVIIIVLLGIVGFKWYMIEKQDVIAEETADVNEKESKEETEVIEEKNEESTDENANTMIYTAEDGKKYEIIGTLNIPSLGIKYPVLSSTSEALLKISLNKYWGPNPHEVGNLCILGHNYENTKFFSKLHNIEIGDVVQLTDINGKTLDYIVYETDIVDPNNNDCTSQLTNGHTEITLITCHNKALQRFIVKARAN